MKQLNDVEQQKKSVNKKNIPVNYFDQFDPFSGCCDGKLNKREIYDHIYSTK